MPASMTTETAPNLATRMRQVSWADALRQASPKIARLLEKPFAKKDLDFDEGLQLSQAEGPDLIALFRAADELRRQTVGDAITYIEERK